MSFHIIQVDRWSIVLAYHSRLERKVCTARKYVIEDYRSRSWAHGRRKSRVCSRVGGKLDTRHSLIQIAENSRLSLSLSRRTIKSHSRNNAIAVRADTTNWYTSTNTPLRTSSTYKLQKGEYIREYILIPAEKLFSWFNQGQLNLHVYL